MRYSLTGELSDWTAAWSHVSGTAPTYSGGNKILTYPAQTSSDYHVLLPAGVSVGDTIEVSYTISGLTGGTFQLGFGSGATGELRNADGTYVERGTLTTNTNLYAYSTNLTGVVTISYIRRVLESGRTNPGEGTIIQRVSLPWDSAIVPSNTTIGILTSRDSVGGLLYVLKTPAGDIGVVAFDGVKSASQYEPQPVSNIRRAVVAQWSSPLGRMRVGLYNPTTGALTWSSPTLAGGQTYRGFFPIPSSNRLRLFYGGGNFPIHVGGLRWSNSIVSDAECVRLSKEMLP